MMQLLEPINVWVYFKQNAIEPYLFFWGSRQIKVDKINLVHTTKNGDTDAIHFSVSSGGNFYRLGLDTKLMKWFLEAVEEGDS